MTISTMSRCEEGCIASRQWLRMTLHHVLLVVENSTQVRVGDQDGMKQDTLSATDVADGPKRGEVIGIGNGTGGHGSSDGHPLVERRAVFRVLVEVLEEADSHHWLESIVAGGQGMREIVPGVAPGLTAHQQEEM